MNFLVGEIGLVCVLGCCEIGYGVLGERVLKYIIFDIVDFLYIICIVSEVFELNGLLF